MVSTCNSGGYIEVLTRMLVIRVVVVVVVVVGVEWESQGFDDDIRYMYIY